jgi:hypothetical protein
LFVGLANLVETGHFHHLCNRFGAVSMSMSRHTLETCNVLHDRVWIGFEILEADQENIRIVFTDVPLRDVIKPLAIISTSPLIQSSTKPSQPPSKVIFSVPRALIKPGPARQPGLRTPWRKLTMSAESTW